jgi:hypothetical protein
MEKTCLFLGELFFKNGEKMFQTDGSIQICLQKFGCRALQMSFDE